MNLGPISRVGAGHRCYAQSGVTRRSAKDLGL